MYAVLIEQDWMITYGNERATPEGLTAPHHWTVILKLKKDMMKNLLRLYDELANFS